LPLRNIPAAPHPAWAWNKHERRAFILPLQPSWNASRNTISSSLCNFPCLRNSDTCSPLSYRGHEQKTDRFRTPKTAGLFLANFSIFVHEDVIWSLGIIKMVRGLLLRECYGIPQPIKSGDVEVYLKTKIALSAALVFSAAVAASAATTNHKISIRQSGLPAPQTIPNSLLDPDPDSPIAAGGGSLGYNQFLHYWW
jgi:hypothetical protein